MSDFEYADIAKRDESKGSFDFKYAVTGGGKHILEIVMRSLGMIDNRLIDHGERVAYIAGMIADIAPKLQIDRARLLILSLLHDIGAYKTEEIDNMIMFDSDGVESHAAFGYAFLKYVSVLSDSAEAILYHHTSYTEMQKINTAYALYAELIYLADRVDILLLSEKPDCESLRRLAGSEFDPELVEFFFEAEEKYAISSHIKDGSYKKELEASVNLINLDERDTLGYLKMLVFSIDFRSPHTVTHTANTSTISVELAELFRMSERETMVISLAAFLHDVGKIAIPYTILEKAGKLSPEEMEVMKTHVEVSERILRGVVSDEVCDIAVRHHEKLNGKGYHRGLTGDDLTLAQRIVAVADVLSALINRRSYKEPFSKGETIAIIGRMRDNGELCPIVCDKLFENYDSIIRKAEIADDPVIKLYDKIKDTYIDLTK